MKSDSFDAWMAGKYIGRNGVGLSVTERSQQLSFARKLEQHEGDLDAHYDSDRMANVLSRLAYTRQDEQRGEAPRHAVPIGSNPYGLTANLRHTTVMYRRFRDALDGVEPEEETSVVPAPSTRRSPGRRHASGQRDWPVWGQPSEADLLSLAHVMTSFVRFLDPEIVRAIVDDNEQHRLGWEEALRERGVDPSGYLWPRSATVFPGVRRHAGTSEIERFRSSRRKGDKDVEHALLLDDNHYPKQLWSFILRGRPFGNFGPDGFQLAHLVDHKVYKNRSAEELEGPIESAIGPAGLPGLFTSAANAVYVPTTFLRPTDFSGLLRGLLQRRAAQLYGSVCKLLPSGLTFRDAPSDAWKTTEFDWAEPVGTSEYLAAFLEFRLRELEALLRHGSAKPVGPSDLAPSKWDWQPGDITVEDGEWDLAYHTANGEHLVVDMLGLLQYFAEQDVPDTVEGLTRAFEDFLTSEKAAHMPPSLAAEFGLSAADDPESEARREIGSSIAAEHMSLWERMYDDGAPDGWTAER